MILVTGATGSIGRHLIRGLQARRVPLRAKVRDEARGRQLGVDFVVADFDDPASLATAMSNVDRLFLNGAGAVPSSGPQPMIRQQLAAIDTAVTAGVTAIGKIFWTPETQQTVLNSLRRDTSPKDVALLAGRRGLVPVADRAVRRERRSTPPPRFSARIMP